VPFLYGLGADKLLEHAGKSLPQKVPRLASEGREVLAPRAARLLHWHDVDVQFVYVLKGWAVFEYEGIGRVAMKAGSCFYQPPRIRHREIRHSPDLQMIEFVSPAKFRTYAAERPAARKSPARRSRG
jgi:mannose-6-phosphate isomerase-like protein (cupin superfamily)